MISSDFIIYFSAMMLAGVPAVFIGFILISRKQAMLIDVISHSSLLGVVLAFLIVKKFSSLAFFIGALLASISSSLFIDIMEKKAKIKKEQATAVVFTGFLALGLFLLSTYSKNVDLDLSCVLFGELLFLPLEESFSFFNINVPQSLVRLGLSSFLVSFFLFIFWRPLFSHSFDSDFSQSTGVYKPYINILFIFLSSYFVISLIKIMGVILPLGLFITPILFGLNFFKNFQKIYLSAILFLALSSVVALPLANKFQVNIGAFLVLTQSTLFLISYSLKKTFAKYSLEPM